jgi:hypothetical protein
MENNAGSPSRPHLRRKDCLAQSSNCGTERNMEVDDSNIFGFAMIPSQFCPDYILEADARSESGEMQYSTQDHWTIGPEWHFGHIVLPIFLIRILSFERSMGSDRLLFPPKQCSRGKRGMAALIPFSILTIRSFRLVTIGHRGYRRRFSPRFTGLYQNGCGTQSHRVHLESRQPN